MSKYLLVAFAVVALAAGCVSVSGPSAAPTVTPTLGITTPQPATPSAAPTAAPTATAAPSPTSGATPQPTGDLGFDQRDVDFYDDLTDPTGDCASPPSNTTPPGCWGVGDLTSSDNIPVGSVRYISGTLDLSLDTAGAWMWSRRVADSISATMRVIGDFSPTNYGHFGLLCGSGDDNLYGAVVGTDGSWTFLSIDTNGIHQLLRDGSAGLGVVAGASNLVALECAGTATGTLRLTLWLGRSGPVATYESSAGPATFDRAAAYAEAAGPAFSVSMDDVIVFGSRIADGRFSTESRGLMDHVPTDWRSSCYQGLRPPYLADTAEAVLTCFLGSARDGAEIAEYAAFSTTDALTAAYDNRTEAFGSGSGADSCRTGSGEHTYNLGEGTPDVGRVLCVDQVSGIRFDWTDTRLNILGTLVDFDGSFSQTFEDWLVGGPNL